MYIIALNGPPRSGKDTLGLMLAEKIEAMRETPPIIMLESLSLPLRHIAYAMVGEKYSDDSYEAFKESFYPAFERTGRQLLIDVSERFLKPVYGQATMAEMLIQRVKYLPDNAVVIIRDSGFQCEMNPLLDAVSTQNLYLVHVKRDGCDFLNDSREWVNHRDSGRTTDVWNNEGFDALQMEASRIYGRLVNQCGWRF